MHWSSLYFSTSILTLTTISRGKCQILPPTLPNPENFVSWLQNLTVPPNLPSIQDLVDSFDVREVEPDDIKFIRHNPDNTTSALDKFPTSTNKPIKIMVHGWFSSGTDDPNMRMAEKYHARGDYDIISVDWSEHSKKIYTHASTSAKTVGSIIGDFMLDSLGDDKQDLLDKVHIIGHSLGAHIAGFAGKRVTEKSSRRIGRITGLDAAAPMFETPEKVSRHKRLDKGDAKFVDVIHTNVGFLGITQAIGQADFYVENGGPLQPGCLKNVVDMFDTLACSHFKAHDYFSETILDGRKFEALQCPNSIQYHTMRCTNNQRTIMGESTPHNTSGVFYLELDSALPYSTFFEEESAVKANSSKND